jgi:fimbrial chaperone protein
MRSLICGALLAGVAVLQPTCAADLQVSPISLQFSPTERAQAVWLINTGKTSLRAQARVYAWKSTGESDVLESTADLAASPPFVEIAPGKKQLVRIVRADTIPPSQEQTFRVIVDELPVVNGGAKDSGEDSRAPEPQSIQFLLRYSIPVFIAPTMAPNAAAAPVSFEWTRSPEPRLKVTNAGARRVRISQLVHIDSSGHRTVLVPGLLGYVLPTSARSWPLPASARAIGAGELKAHLDDNADESLLARVRLEN